MNITPELLDYETSKLKVTSATIKASNLGAAQSYFRGRFNGKSKLVEQKSDNVFILRHKG